MKSSTIFAILTLTGSSLGSAAVLSLFGNGSTTTPAVNKAAPVGALTVSTLSGAGLSGPGSPTTIAVRDAFGTGLYITGSSPAGAGTTAGSNWLWTNNQNWGTTAPTSTNRYFQFSLTADAGSSLDLSNITFDWQSAINSQTTTATFAYQMFYSTDGGATFNSIGTGGTKAVGNALGTSTDWGTLTSETIDLSPIVGASNVTFRLGMAGTGTTTGSFTYFFQNITVNGDVVPEPSAALLGSLGILALLRRRR